MINILKKLSVMFVTIIILVTSVIAPITASAATADELRNKVLAVAQGEIGYAETGNNITKYGDWYGVQGGWCTTFAIWCFDQADKAYGTKMYKNIVPSGGSCVTMRNWFINKGSYQSRTSGYVPQKGDFIFFDWNGDGKSQHVGIVESASSSTVSAIEGNASDKVKRNSYSLSKSTIMGYGVVNFSQYGSSSSEGNTTPPTTTVPPTTSVADTAVNPYTAIVTTEKLNVRNSPSSSGGVVTTLGKDALVTVNAKNSDWLKVSFTKNSKKYEGYVSAGYVKEYVEQSTTQAQTTQSNDKAVDLTGMKVFAANDQIKIGESIKLNYSLKPESANATVTYTSMDENILTVSQEGVVTAVNSGEGVIKVVANDEIERNYTFYVEEDAQAVAASFEVDEVAAEENTSSKSSSANKNNNTGSVKSTKEIQEKNESINTSPDLTVTFLASGVCAVGIAGFIPAIRKRKIKDSQDFIERIGNLKK